MNINLRLFADEATMQDILIFECKDLRRAHLHFRLLLFLNFFFRAEGILDLNICEQSDA